MVRIPHPRAFLRTLHILAALMAWRGLKKFIECNASKIPSDAHVLQVGSGGRVEKIMTPLREKRGFKLTTLDIDPARKPDIVADIIDYDPGECFDYILVIEVLEHIKHPHAAAQNLYKLLKPGGTLVLSTPFLFPLHDRPYDYFRFTKYGLAELFGHFDRVVIKERDSWAEVHCVFLARLLREKSLGIRIFSPIAIILAMLLYPLAMLLSHLINTDAFTIGYTLVGRRPD